MAGPSVVADFGVFAGPTWDPDYEALVESILNPQLDEPSSGPSQAKATQIEPGGVISLPGSPMSRHHPYQRHMATVSLSNVTR